MVTEADARLLNKQYLPGSYQPQGFEVVIFE